jgi:ABC-type uncharacterized transport system involved in gliding motility auxiliary subunit
MTWSRSTIATVALILAVVLFFALNIASNIFFRSWRLDLTQNGLFTLSQGTVDTLQSIPEPVTLRFFYSDRLAAKYVGLRAYGQRVRDLLQEYVGHSNGKLKLEVVDPEPLTDEEDLAVAEGVTGAPINGETLYFGLVGTNMVNGREVIPLFSQDRERYLEYDLTSLVYKLTREKKPKIGIVTNLPLETGLGGMQAALQGRSQPFVIYQQMQETFDLQFLEQDFDRVPADIDVVMIAHPKQLNAKTLYALDQFIMRGGRAFVLLDPLSEIAKQEMDPSGNPSSIATISSASNIDPLLKSWGVHVDPRYVIGDGKRALSVNTGAGVKAYLPWLGLEQEDFNTNDPVIGDLQTLNIGSVGMITPVDGRTTKVTPLIQSTNFAMQIDVGRIQFQPDPDELVDNFIPTGERYTLAARITGPAKTAFPNGPPPVSIAPPTTPPAPGAATPGPLPAQIKEAKDVNIILLADSDIFNDQFWVQVQDMAGQRIAQPVAGNNDFVLNALDNLGGSSQLLSLRSRGTSRRPFDLVENMRRSAQAKFSREQKVLEAKVAETEKRLQELQGQRTVASQPGQAKPAEVFSPEQNAEIEKFRQQYFSSRRALRDVQRRLSSDIDFLGGALAAINILLVPLTIAGVAIALGVIRRRRKAQPKPASEGAAS